MFLTPFPITRSGLRRFLTTETSTAAKVLAFWPGFPVLPFRRTSTWNGGETVRDASSRGAVVQRLRLVSNPLTSYEEYELNAGYYAGVAAGEDIRVAPRSELAVIDDAWFFDSRIILHQKYHVDGSYLSAEEAHMTTEDHAYLARALELFLRSKKLEDYLEGQ